MHDVLTVKNDPVFALDFFSHQLNFKLEKTQEIAKEIYNVVVNQAPVAVEVASSLKKDFRYVVDISDDMKSQIKKGIVKLVKENDKLYAQIRNNKGRYSDKLSIKEEQLTNFNPAQIANAMQMQAIQSQLEAISNQLNCIDLSVRAVIVGQQNDRLAGCESGKNLYLEALNVKDEQLKMALKVQALKSLSDASCQLRLTIKSDIDFLKNKEFKSAKGKQIEQIDSRMSSIHQSFEAIHNSTLMKAGIYCNEEEYDAMHAVLNDYSTFIEQTVKSNATLLAQWDKNDDGTNEGVWQTRASLKLDKVLQQNNLENEQVFYIGIAEGEYINEDG